MLRGVQLVQGRIYDTRAAIELREIGFGPDAAVPHRSNIADDVGPHPIEAHRAVGAADEVGVGEVVGDEGRLQLHADADRGQVLRHGRHHVRHGRAAPVGRPVQRDVETIRVAGLRHQLPSEFGVVVVLDFRPLLRGRVTVHAAECEQGIVALAEHEVVDDGLAVDRVVRRLAHAGVEERVRAAVRHRLGIQVGIEHLDGRPVDGGLELHGEVGVVQVRLHVIGAQSGHHVDLARLEAGQLRLDLGPHHDLQMLVVGVTRDHDGMVDGQEVVLETLEDEVRVVFVADEAVGTGAHR